MTGKTPRVRLEWPAVCDLRAMPWDDRFELGGILMGVVKGDEVIVRQIVANPSGPQETHRTTVEFDAVFDIETHPVSDNYRGKGSPPHRIVGDVHSHPEVGPPQPSPADREHARAGSQLVGQDAATFVCLIVGPRKEVWESGFPTGEFDWEDPYLRALIGVDGEVSEALVTTQPAWLFFMQAEREEWNAAHTTR